MLNTCIPKHILNIIYNFKYLRYKKSFLSKVPFKIKNNICYIDLNRVHELILNIYNILLYKVII